MEGLCQNACKGAKVATNRSAKKEKPEKLDPVAIAPAPLDLSKASVYEILRRAASIENPEVAMALYEALGPRVSQEDTDRLLCDRASSIRYHFSQPDIYIGRSRFESDRTGLAWADFLIQKGADPFKAKGSKKEYDYEPSLFETLVWGGYWSYAERLMADLPDGVQRAGEAMSRDEARQLGGIHSAKSTSRSRAFMQGGARGLALAFSMGIGPNAESDDYPRPPWVFECQTAEQLGAFIQAGVDLSVKSAQGATLEEALSARAPSKEKDEMLKLLRAQENRAALDPEAVARSLAEMARSGSNWTEMKRAAKANAADPLKIKTSEGDDLLAVALGAGNWALARGLIDAGADPSAACSLKGLPTIAWALVSSPPLSWSRKSPGAKAIEKRDALEEGIFQLIDWSWRGPGGERLLEAALAAKAKAKGVEAQETPSYTACKRMARMEPLTPSEPLWGRLARLGAETYMVSEAALKRPEESWMDPELGSLMGWMMAQRLPRYRSEAYAVRDQFSDFARDLKYEFGREEEPGKGGFERGVMSSRLLKAYQTIFAPEQWESAFGTYWKAVADADSTAAEDIASRMKRYLSLWIEKAQEGGVEPFDFNRLSKAIVAPLNTGGHVQYKVSENISELAEMLVRKFPDKAGVIVLDLLDAQSSSGLSAGHRIWTRLAASRVELELPGSHRLLCEPGAIRPELAHHPVWRDIEATLLARQTQRPAPRMR